jgi:hypothetical protein
MSWSDQRGNQRRNRRPNQRRVAWRDAAFVAAAWLALALIAFAYFKPRAAAAGWLIGFTFWAQILIGSLTLIMTHRLTSGRWGEIIAPVIEPAAAAVPLLILLSIPIFVAIPLLYPWPQRPDAIKPEVLSYYLNTPAYVARTLIALFGWSALAMVLPRIAGGSGRLIAGLGLIFHTVIISSIAVDWYLSPAAPFTSSSFGASVAVSALVAALAWAALAMRVPQEDPAIGDVGALLLATILGITYIDFMAVLVIWYGDIPREEIWFVARDRLPWSTLAIAAFVLTSLLPVLALLLSRIRNRATPLRAVGGCVLVGLACYDAYLIAPPSPAFALIAAVLALGGIGLALIGCFAARIDTLFSSREPADAR